MCYWRGNPAPPEPLRPPAEGEWHGEGVQQVDAQCEQRASQEEGHVRAGIQVERGIPQVERQPTARTTTHVTLSPPRGMLLPASRAASASICGAGREHGPLLAFAFCMAKCSDADEQGCILCVRDTCSRRRWSGWWHEPIPAPAPAAPHPQWSDDSHPPSGQQSCLGPAPASCT